MTEIEYAIFLKEKERHSREHQQLLRDSKAGTLDLSKYHAKIPTRLVFKDDRFKNEMIRTFLWVDLRLLVDKNHKEANNRLATNETIKRLNQLSIFDEPVLVDGNLNTDIFDITKRVMEL
jgi:hypothetical protein